jgi:hypothetical protein
MQRNQPAPPADPHELLQANDQSEFQNEFLSEIISQQVENDHQLD